jgi:hypothetical protein
MMSDGVRNTLSRATFLECVGSTFRLHREPEPPMELTLSEAKALGTPGSTYQSRREPFSLLFHGPKSFYVPQKIYPLEHEAIGTLEIFLVPVGPDERGMRYEAIFN